MKKIPTVFLRDWDNDPKHVTREPHPDCTWVLAGEGRATLKWDGTCVMYDLAQGWSARREVKPGKTPPPNFEAISTDEETGKTIGWEPIEQSPFRAFFDEAFGRLLRANRVFPGTYELIGPKINGNPQDWPHHELIRHGEADILRTRDLATAPRDYDGLRDWLTSRPYEGIVWHHEDGRRAKLKAKDFPKPEVAS